MTGEYVRRWKDSGVSGSFQLTPDSFFLRMDDMDLYQILRFREPLEACAYLRYRSLPDMLDESSDSLFLDIQTLREKIEDKGVHCRCSGMELLGLLDEVIASGRIDPGTLDKMIILFNSTSFYAFHYTYYMRYWIRAHGQVVAFLADDVFREDFDHARKLQLIDFIELDLILKGGEFDTSDEHHLKMASNFMDWAGDPIRQTETRDG